MKKPRNVISMRKGSAGYLGVGRFRRTGKTTVRCTVCGWEGSHVGLARASHLKACKKRNDQPKKETVR